MHINITKICNNINTEYKNDNTHNIGSLVANCANW